MPDPNTIIIRSGGLGDFVLTLPFIAKLGALSRSTTVVTRNIYARLVQDDFPDVQFVDIDGPKFASMICGRCDILPLLDGATVYSFLPDSDGSLSRTLCHAGADRYVQLESRPTSPPHIVEQMFGDADQEWSDSILCASVLEPAVGRETGNALWIHPGSGSPAKNAPLSFFAKEARKRGAAKLIVSYGEADLDLVEPAREIFANFETEHLVLPDLKELRDRLSADAAAFIGNDTGVTHLAAALGVPTTAVFVKTDPAVWRPSGCSVNTFRF